MKVVLVYTGYDIIMVGGESLLSGILMLPYVYTDVGHVVGGDQSIQSYGAQFTNDSLDGFCRKSEIRHKGCIKDDQPKVLYLWPS